MKTVNIVAPWNGAGLSRDIQIIQRTLEAGGHQVFWNEPGGCFDVQLFLERLIPERFAHARSNCLIPNQEFFEPVWRPLIGRLDRILTKTRAATETFERLGARVSHVGFTSEDRYLEVPERDPNHWFHLVGGSPYKGTEVLLRVWQKLPDLPTLTVLQRQDRWRKLPHIRHVNVVTAYLGDHLLRVMQSSLLVHLCPSEVEGWGHSIMEALSTGAVVLTTDAPPMNELVTVERGLLCEPYRRTPRGLGMRYFVHPAHLEQRVQCLRQMCHDQKLELGAAARRFFLENDARFKQRLNEIVESL